jgi:glycosyltransferase involved in cell wall biosynthesis
MASPPLKASIIIPARDAIATVSQTIESVLMDAGNEDIEIIVVNDGLDESTAKLADHYPVKVIPGNGNGIAAARNIGLKSSSGDILIFLDADCQVLPGWLKSHLEAHERYGGLLAIGGSLLSVFFPFHLRILYIQ